MKFIMQNIPNQKGEFILYYNELVRFDGKFYPIKDKN